MSVINRISVKVRNEIIFFLIRRFVFKLCIHKKYVCPPPTLFQLNLRQTVPLPQQDSEKTTTQKLKYYIEIENDSASIGLCYYNERLKILCEINYSFLSPSTYCRQNQQRFYTQNICKHRSSFPKSCKCHNVREIQRLGGEHYSIQVLVHLNMEHQKISKMILWIS